MPRPERQGIADSVNRGFGAYVEELAAGRSNRDLWAMTGVSHSRIGDMRAGFVPSYRLLERFADNLKPPLTGEQRQRLFEEAGYAPAGLRPSPRDHYHQRLGELLDLCAELEVEPMLADFYGGEQGQVQTHEDADRVADALVRDQIRSYPEHAERFRALLRGEG